MATHFKIEYGVDGREIVYDCKENNNEFSFVVRDDRITDKNWKTNHVKKGELHINIKSSDEMVSEMDDTKEECEKDLDKEVEHDVKSDEDDSKDDSRTEHMWITDDIEKHMVETLFNHLNNCIKHKKTLFIHIHSFGGNASTCYSMYDLIKEIVHRHGIKVYTVNHGVAQSSAAIIFLAGTKRYMLPSSSIMFHSAYQEVEGNSYELELAQKELIRMDNIDYAIFEELGLDREFIDNMFNSVGDIYFDANESLEHGICTHIGLNKRVFT